MALLAGLDIERKKKRKRNNNNMAYLPIEIVMEIISKLPINTIFQFSQKFPEFKLLIFDPYFDHIFQLYHSSTIKPPCTLLGFHDHEAWLIEYRGDTNSKKIVHIMYAFNMSFVGANEKAISTHVACSTNGWILVPSIHKLDDDDDDDVCGHLFESLRVVNPATRKCLIFHREPVVVNQQQDFMFGPKYVMGYSSKTGNYKVVKFVQSSNLDCSFEVFDLLSHEKRWKKIDFDYQGHTPRSPVVLNDALHWLTWDNTILKFDIDDEEFEFIPTPYSENTEMSTTFLVACCGLLHFGAYKLMNFIEGLEIWVMKEYGMKETWIRLSVIQVHDFCPYVHLELFQVLNNGKMLFISYKEKNLHLYDIETGAREVLVMKGMSKKKRRKMRILPFVPSFLSLDGRA